MNDTFGAMERPQYSSLIKVIFENIRGLRENTEVPPSASIFRGVFVENILPRRRESQLSIEPILTSLDALWI